ncbi:penicillin acylase family protein [Microbacterium sp. 4R-513]|uniref:penicillin acylase family protein n=1 Tax=Microbacterium sp. 4R-513 TaxID=2567934 RepID=UPI0013E1319F|nr:penicillin acylase family protein [Microbacterium sp. 4R-513]QIG39647.1 penicillin acylase family protein [Microbacterium sp. 4R-513]
MTARLYRDDLGIPHVRADHVLDLADAQGEVTARDRAWQIEVGRLKAEGRLAELIGRAGVAWDVFARRARLDDTARRAFGGLDAGTTAFVRAYAEGVRRGLAATTASEFAALDAHFGVGCDRGEWPDHGPLLVMHAAHVLFTSYPAILWREHVVRTLGEDWAELFEAGEAGPTSGSNAWALHGSRTGSGMPLLAGDPHRMFELPGVYQQVRLACDEFDVVGLTFPGVPGVQHFGHAGSVAWGITNAMAHGADVLRETLRRAPDGWEALGPGGWQPARVERSIIRVRGGDDIEVEAIETARGPVVTDLREDGSHLVGWSVRLPARADGDLGFSSLLPLLHARSADDVVTAFGGWVDPVNRLLAADTTGAVRSATVGRPFARPAAQRLLALDAPLDDVAPAAPLPRAIDVEDCAVDANERPDRPDVDLGSGYAAPYRADRIRVLLDELRPRSIDDFPPIWGDTRLGSAEALLAHLPSGPLAGPEEDVRRALAQWDGRMDAASVPAAMFAAWRDALVRRVVSHPALARLHEPHAFGAVYDSWFGLEAHVARGLLRLLAHPPLAQDAASLARDALSDVAGTQADAWGARHRLMAAHVLGAVPGMDDPAAGFAVALDGDGDTVRCTASTPGLSARAWRGSVARWAWDLADRERSVWNVPFGASGDPASPHHADQLGAWVEVRPARIVTAWERLRDEGTIGR